MTYFRPEIEQMPGYTPGEQPQAGKFIKLNTNENPYPASPAVGRAIAAVVAQGLGRYPDPMATAFAAGRPKCCRSSRIGFCAATAATIC